MTPFKRRLRALIVFAMVIGVCTPAIAATTLAVNQNANHKTFKIKLGMALSLSLDSTYWQLTPPSGSSAVVQVGEPGVVPAPMGPSAPPGCRVPGSGCGTVTWHFKAARTGVASIVANRTSCGEAMQCAPDKKRFSIKVIVTK